MLDGIIAGAILVLLIAGFWWTRGAGGMPGGVDDPAQAELQKYTRLGDRMPDPGEEAENRGHEAE